MFFFLAKDGFCFSGDFLFGVLLKYLLGNMSYTPRGFLGESPKGPKRFLSGLGFLEYKKKVTPRAAKGLFFPFGLGYIAN